MTGEALDFTGTVSVYNLASFFFRENIPTHKKKKNAKIMKLSSSALGRQSRPTNRQNEFEWENECDCSASNSFSRRFSRK
jgi:hypothetical protein